MSKRRRSLLEKVSGPNAVPVATLVARGETAARRVQETFDDFLKLRLRELEAVLADLKKEKASAACDEMFYTIVHDIRGSSATAGNPTVSLFCLSLERLLQEREPQDARMDAAIDSHINALNLVAAHGALDKASQVLLMAQLSRAVDCLPLKQAGSRFAG